MEKSIIIDVGISYTRAAILEDDELVNVFLENNDHKQIQGTIYQGKVSNVVKGIKAAFIRIGHEKQAFLHYKDIPEQLKGRLQHNQRIMVQVLKEGAGSKGPKVTSFINLAGKYLILLPFEKNIGISKRIMIKSERKRLKSLVKEYNPKKYGIIVRTGAAKASEEELKAELRQLTQRWEEIETRAIGAAGETVLYEEPSLPVRAIREYANENIKEIVINGNYQEEFMKEKVRMVDRTTDLYGAYSIDKEIERALQRRIWLKCGSNIMIEKTEAMHVIDVNSAKFTKVKNQSKMILKANLQAAKESARQIRIRNLSGIIMIDFIDMKNPQHRKKIVEVLQQELDKDKAKSQVYPVTKLGIVQITRERSQPSLAEQITQNCPCCNKIGAYVSYDYMLVHLEKDIREIARESIHKHVEIVSYEGFVKHVDNKPLFKREIQSRYGLTMHLLVDDKTKKGQYDLQVK